MVHVIPETANSYTHIVHVHHHGETNVVILRRRCDWQIQDGRQLPEVHMQCPISHLLYKITTTFKRLPPHFRDPATR